MSGCARLPAFPGAEGHGALAVGGRGGSVVHVNRLDDNRRAEPMIPGTLRWALHQPSPKTIVFDVGGVIELQDPLDVPRDRAGQTTIAGQTAPGGITLHGTIRFLGSTSEEGATDFIIRQVRFRSAGTHSATTGKAANNPTSQEPCVSFHNGGRLILDHCSFSGAADDLLDLTGTNSWSVQWCTFEVSAVPNDSKPQRDPRDGHGGLRFGSAEKWSLHHCLLTNIARDRTEDIYGLVDDGEMVNCVIYKFRDWESAIPASQTANLVGNTWMDGLGDRPADVRAAPFGSSHALFSADNHVLPPRGPEYRLAAAADRRELWSIDGPAGHTAARIVVADRPCPSTVNITTQDAQAAYSQVLDRAGAWPRDRTTRQLLETMARESKSQVAGRHYENMPRYANGPTSIANDTDRDGMPDTWERVRGLNPIDPEDRNGLAPELAGKYAGYTNLEWYLNELADSRIAALPEFVELTVSAMGKGKVYHTTPGNTAQWQPMVDPESVPLTDRRSVGTQIFHRQEWVGLKAIADPGYTFAGWRGGTVDGSRNPLVFARLDQDVAITAIFQERLPDVKLKSELPMATYEGAEGFGAICKGGRVENSKEIHVTRMDDPVFARPDYIAWTHLTPGTLRWAMHQPGPKKIIFDQPGTIRLSCPIQLTTQYNGPLSVSARVDKMTFNETRQAVTIVGEIRLDRMNGAETVWLNTRFRAALWNNGWRPFKGGPQSTGDCLFLEGAGNCMVDHCEFSGGADEMFNYILGNGKLTLQWCTFFEAFKHGDFGMKWGDDGAHNYGGLITFVNGADTGLTVHHCYFANLGKRMPTEVSSIPANPPPRFCEYINNTFYNWREYTGGFQARESAWYQGNIWKYGPSVTEKARNGSLGYASPAYIADNLIQQGEAANDLPSAHRPMGLQVLGDKPPAAWHTFPVTVQPREKAIRETLEKAGVFPLDNVSKANRDSYSQDIGWQGAHPEWRTNSLDEYLNWATATAPYLSQ